MMGKKISKWKYLLLALVLGAGVGAFVSFGPPKLLAKSETPEFCASCHVMEAQYEAWFHEGAHRRKQCVECHLPHGSFAEYYAWKGVTGMNDVMVFNSGRIPEPIKISSHGKKILRENCIRCHETLVENIAQDRDCWECHRRLSHTRSGYVMGQ
jgi:cytochrome c nitrite reductase small subunit